MLISFCSHSFFFCPSFAVIISNVKTFLFLFTACLFIYLFILLQFFWCVYFCSVGWLFVCFSTMILYVCALKKKQTKKQSNYLQSIKMMLNCILLIICNSLCVCGKKTATNAWYHWIRCVHFFLLLWNWNHKFLLHLAWMQFWYVFFFVDFLVP